MTLAPLGGALSEPVGLAVSDAPLSADPVVDALELDVVELDLWLAALAV